MHHVRTWVCLVVLCAQLSIGYNWQLPDVESSEEDVLGGTDENLNCSSWADAPGLNQQCWGCCKLPLTCYNGACEICYENKKWICSNHVRNQDMLFTATQIAMTAALVLGIITILILLWKICAGAGHRPLTRRRNARRRVRESGRSVDTLQQIVTERLRDAPPPYVGTILPPPGDTPPAYNSLENNLGHVNACFDPDYNAPPPCYNSITIQSPEGTVPKADIINTNNDVPKANENASDSTLHI